VHPDLESLLALQEKDEAVTATDAALAALEPEVRVLDDALAAAERTLENARREIQVALGRRGELEGKIANYRTMQEQRRQRLEWVRGAKEASTLMAELDLARSVLAKEEAEFMRSGDAVTETERRAAEAEKALEELKSSQAEAREGLGGRREEIVARRELAQAEREQAATAVNASLLVRYEKIRRGKRPLAVYAVHGDACGRCYTAVPTQRRVLIQRGASIESCEACGVLLYAVDSSTHATK
jgi:predicted  nucleic acid-binding Zn-ribbon protein